MHYTKKVMGALVIGMLAAGSYGMKADAAFDGVNLQAGITASFDQKDSTQEAAKVVAETVWVGTPLEGYGYIGVAHVDDNVNVRAEASTDSKIVGKMRNQDVCEILGQEGDWLQIESGEVTGYVKAEYIYTGEDAIRLALEMCQEMAKVTSSSLYVRMEPSTEADYWTMVPQGERLQVMEDLGEWIKVDIDGEEGYVAAEFVEMTSEVSTALTITEALYGEGISDVRIAVSEFAKQYVGNRYVWGGTSLTKGADCSGFTLAVFRNFGISLPHSSKAQINSGRRIDVSEAQAGDLIFYGNGKSINHVALCIGGGRVVHASNSRTGIIISNMYYRTPVGAADILGV